MIPIPAWLVTKVGETTAKLIVWAACALLAIGIVVGGYIAVKHFFTGGIETQVKVTSGQLGAQSASGHDAVQTIGNVMGNEQAIDQITEENGNVIDHASGADVAVDPAVRSAGLQSLCRRPSYRDAHPACVQQPAP